MKKHIRKICFMMILVCLVNPVHAITLALHDTLTYKGAFVDIPVYAEDDLTGSEVSAYSLQLEFDGQKMQVADIITNQTLSGALGTPVVNTTQAGIVTISAAGTGYLSGNGILIIVRFKLLDSGGTYLNFTGKSNNYMNEGNPALTFRNAWININNPPSIEIYSDRTCLAVGDSLQLWVWGGNEPYKWAVSDLAKATVSQTGLLKTLQEGNITVYAEDINGIKDSLTNFIIRPVKLSIPGNLTQWKNNDIDIPVYSTDLSSGNINSGSFRLNFNTALIQPEDLITEGTLLENCQVMMNKDNNGIHIAFASKNTISGAGTLLYIRCKITEDNSYSTQIDFAETVFNENIYAVTENGRFTTQQFEQLFINPFSGEILAGDSLQMEAQGELTPPLLWTVGDPAIAEISSGGVLRAKHGGKTKVFVSDSKGAKGFSDYFYLLDASVSLPDTLICMNENQLRLPLKINYITLQHQISSMQFELLYDTARMTYTGLSSEDGITSDWLHMSNDQSGRILYAGSGASSVSQTGTLLYFNFILKNSFSIYDWAGFTLDNLRMNEGNPVVNTTGYGSVRRDDIPGKPEIVWGDTLLSENTFNTVLTINEVANSHNYVWTLPEGMTGSSTTNSIGITASDQFVTGKVSVAATNNCGPGEAFEFTVTKESHSGNVSISNEGYLCYPNPAKEKIKVRISENEIGKTYFMLYDIPGKLIKNNILHSRETEINLSDIAEGIYLIRIQSDKKTIFMRIMKE
ncbi:MAG: cohesin domain-containing protein [Paludibacter sp.]|nr:cohesin domain-containing protein [Paludibacter sp.]